MKDLTTERLLLHAVDVAEAQAILDDQREGQSWAADFPFEGDVDALRGFLRASDAQGEQRPFGFYLIRRRSDGLAVGGIGFNGPPTNGAIEIGYGLAASARGHGYASEAVDGLVRLVATLGVTSIIAETEPANEASIKTLQRSNFHRVGVAADGNLSWTRPVSSPPG